MSRVLAVASLVALAACSNERVSQLEARLAEVKSENERLSRDLADLRKQVAASHPADGSAAPATTSAAASDDRVGALDASLTSVLVHLSDGLPPAPLDGTLTRTWIADDHGAEEALQLRADGKLCGFVRASGGEKAPFWGTWSRRGRFLLELHDRWVGDHNEHDARLRTIGQLTASGLDLQGGETRHFQPVPAAEEKKLAALYPDRDTRIPGLPEWCLAGK